MTSPGSSPGSSERRAYVGEFCREHDRIPPATAPVAQRIERLTSNQKAGVSRKTRVIPPLFPVRGILERLIACLNLLCGGPHGQVHRWLLTFPCGRRPQPENTCWLRK